MISLENLYKGRPMFSGIQPTGELHIGNYFGAIASWKALLDQQTGIFCIVDYHAITVPYDAKKLSKLTFDAAMTYLACGLDPERCIIFVQSQVPEHTELAWIFSTLAPLGLLERMTQFKDKSEQHRDHINLGLFAYPVLQAADILLYNASLVPVGEDQAQHLELTRDLARKFNNAFGKFFCEPQTYLSKTPRILGIYGQEKMSKSKGNHVPIFSSKAEFKSLVGKAVTDTKRVRRSDPGEPKDCPLYSNIHALVTPEQQRMQLAEGCRSASIGCGDCKAALIDNLEGFFGPMREKRCELAAKPEYVQEVLAHGATTARAMAKHNMAIIKKKLGLSHD